MRQLLLMITMLATAGLLAACGTDEAELPEPIDALNEAAVFFQTAESFKIEVLQEGAPYFIETDVTEGALRFQRATIDYQAPDTLQGDVRASVFGAPFPFGVLARGTAQWVRLPGIGWTNSYVFAPGFNPQDLIAEEKGFQAALSALLDIEMVGPADINGVPVFHMTGRADGAIMRDLLVGLLEVEGEVLVDVYVQRDNNQPVRLIITMPDTETEDVPEPTRWVLDVYDFDQPVTIDGPELGDPGTVVTAEPIAATEDVGTPPAASGATEEADR